MANILGKERTYKTPASLEKVIKKYFDVTPDEELTVTGLALACGSGRENLDNYMRRPEFTSLVKRAKAVVENSYERSLRRTGRSGDIFVLKNMGWSDRQELVGDVTAPIAIQITSNDSKI